MPLPPLGVDRYREWAASRWRELTDNTIGRVQSGLWDMQAEDQISRLQPLELPEPQPVYHPPEPAYEPPPPPPPAPAPTPQSPLDAVRGGIGSTLSGIGQRAATALSGARGALTGGVEAAHQTAGGWADRAEETIGSIGDHLGGGFAQAQAAPLPTLEAPSTFAPSTPLEQVGAMASRIPRAAAQPFLELPETVASLPYRFGEGVEALRTRSQEEAGRTQASLTDFATGVNEAAGTDVITPEQAAWWSDTGAGMAGGLRRGQRGPVPRLTPEQQALRVADGEAEQTLFDAIRQLWRRGPEGEAAADDLRFLSVGKGQQGLAAAREYLSGKGLDDVLGGRAAPGVLPPVQAARQAVGTLGRGVEWLRERSREQEARDLEGDVGYAEAMNRAAQRGGYQDVITPQEARFYREVGEDVGAGLTKGAVATTSRLRPQEALRRALRGAPGAGARQLDLTEAPEAVALTEEARRVLATPRPPASDAAAVTNWDRAVAWMTSNALSNPRSLTGNALGGAEQTLGRFGRYAAQGRPQDAWRELGAWWGAKGDVADATWNAFWKGERPPQVGATVGATAETAPGAFAGPKGVLATPAGRIAGATDAFFSMLARAGGEAVGDARGLTGEAREAFVKEQVQQAVLAGTPSVFTRMVGDLKSLINSPDLGDKLKAAAALVYVPFARVPEVIWRQGLYRTVSPLTDLPAAGYHALKGNPQKARNAVQRWATNSAIAGPVLWQVGQGNLTGSGPDDPAKRRDLEATGWRPNSVRIGDEWYSYDWLGPLGLQMNALATIAETWAEAGKEPDADAYKKVDKVVNRMGQLAYDEFYLRNFFDLMGAVKDGRMTDSLERTATEAGSRLIPYSAAQNWLAGGTDPLEREPETPLERVQARTVLRQAVPARIDPTTGEPQRRGGTPAERLGGFGRPTTEATPLTQEVARLHQAGQEVSVPVFTPGEKYKDVEQTRPQRRVLQQVYGSEVAAATRELLASPDYQQADEKEKARLLRRQVTVARARADVLAGDRVARSPKGKAELAYLAVPHYEGMGRNLTPEAVRLENLRTAEAKGRLADARKKYPGNPDKGETEFLRADREGYRRAERFRVDAETLAARKQAIEQEYGVDLP